MRIYFYALPIHIKTDAFIYCIACSLPSCPQLTLRPLNPPVTGHYHHSLIFGFVSNNMASVNHARLTTVTATTNTLPRALQECLLPVRDYIVLEIFSKTEAIPQRTYLMSPHVYYCYVTILYVESLRQQFIILIVIIRYCHS